MNASQQAFINITPLQYNKAIISYFEKNTMHINTCTKQHLYILIIRIYRCCISVPSGHIV